MQIILGLFPDAAQAQAATQALFANNTTLQAANIGIVSKDPDGQIDFLETAEERELRHLSTLGRVTGWLLGLAGAVVGAAELGATAGLGATATGAAAGGSGAAMTRCCPEVAAVTTGTAGADADGTDGADGAAAAAGAAVAR